MEKREEMSEWTIFGERLKKQLEERGMTYREFAEKVGLSVPTIKRYVQCQYVPRATELLKIANVLGVNCNYLLGVINDPYRDCPHHPKENLPSADLKLMAERCIPEECKDDLVNRREVYRLKLMSVTDWDFGQALINLPSAEPERKKGKWIKDVERFGDNAYHCNQCGAVLEKDDLEWRNNYYCYHCGAGMRGEEDE